jgi:hypothetical protein
MRIVLLSRANGSGADVVVFGLLRAAIAYSFSSVLPATPSGDLLPTLVVWQADARASLAPKSAGE